MLDGDIRCCPVGACRERASGSRTHHERQPGLGRPSNAAFGLQRGDTLRTVFRCNGVFRAVARRRIRTVQPDARPLMVASLRTVGGTFGGDTGVEWSAWTSERWTWFFVLGTAGSGFSKSESSGGSIRFRFEASGSPSGDGDVRANGCRVQLLVGSVRFRALAAWGGSLGTRSESPNQAEPAWGHPTSCWGSRRPLRWVLGSEA